MQNKLLIPIIKKNILITFFLVLLTIFSLSVTLVAISLYRNLTNDYNKYNDKYGQYDLLVETDFSSVSEYQELKELYGVSKIYHRISFDLNLLYNETSFTSKIHTFNDDSFESFYIISEKKNDTAYPSIYLEYKFAEINKIEAGSLIDVSIIGTSTKCYVEKLITNPETIYFNYYHGIWINPSDFAYVFIYKDDFKVVLDDLVKKIEEKRKDSEFKKYSDIMLGEYLPIYNQISSGDFYYDNYFNQSLILLDENYHQDVNHFIDVSGIKDLNFINNIITKDDSPSCYYMNRVTGSLKIVAYTFSILFYGLVLIIAVLFVSHIIKVMKKVFANLISIGMARLKIMKIMILYVVIVSIIGNIIGYFSAHLLLKYVISVCRNAYNLHELSSNIYWPAYLLLFILTTVLFVLAVILSMKKIFKISIIDAMQKDRVKIPNVILNKCEKINSSNALSITLFFQNISKHLINFTSYFMVTILILVSYTFYLSQKNVIKQTVYDRMDYDVDVYLDSNNEEKLNEVLKDNETIIYCENTYFILDNISSNNIEIESSIEGIDKDLKLLIPSKNGKKRIDPNKLNRGEIILSRRLAEILNVKIGDEVIINNHSFKIIDLSYQYMVGSNYILKEDFTDLYSEYYDRYMIKSTDTKKLVADIEENSFGSLFLTKDKMIYTLSNTFEIFDVISIGLIVVAALIGFAIISMINTSTFIDELPLISTLKSLGYSNKRVHQIWIKETILELIPALSLGIGIGCLVEYYFLLAVTGKGQIYPFVNYLYPYILIIIFIILLYALTTIIVFRRIKHIDVASNIKSRE